MKAIDDKFICERDMCCRNGERYLPCGYCDKVLCEKRIPSRPSEQESAVIGGWVARDGNGEIFLHGDKPYKDRIYWQNASLTAMKIDTALFPSLTWESEAKKVRIQITPTE